MKIEMLLENKNYYTFRLIDFKNDFVVVINKNIYLNPPNYNSVMGRYFSNKSNDPEGLDVENGSIIKDLVDEYFKTLDKSK